MSTEALAGPAVSDTEPVYVQEQPRDQIQCAAHPVTTFLHSPPDSNDAAKSDASDSELSDLDEEPVLEDASTLVAELQSKAAEEQQPAPVPQISEPQPEAVEEEDIGEVLPDHWTNGVPVFKPTIRQFKDFNLFMRKVDSYGMKSGIIKIVPPQEWKDAQPDLGNLVKQIKVREPIKQDIMGSNGTYRQVNILHGRSYNLPQWRQLCEQSEHQPPAKRGERRANAEKPKPSRARQAAPRSANPATPTKRRRGRPAKSKGKSGQKDEDERPMTPVSPKPETEETKQEPVDSIEDDLQQDVDEDNQPPAVGRMGAVRPAKAKTQSTSARRKYSRREGSAAIDEAAFKDFDYRLDISDYTPERCEELERSYWKTLTYAPPLYGADLMGTLFDDRTENWNLNKLPNILDVLGTKVPGVNTAYLYLGMWKATFAWHLEDVDLYSINYLHFGAPKQWYSISQGDARRFEAAMKSIWPTDAKACDQFLRHKAFLISPQHLLQNFGIRVNKCLSYPGEFVVTYPYGYHSGYNLGYNCAEAVNFALDSWLDMGKIAKKCECAQAQDSVWINVYEIERKLRGEETEYEETEDEEDEDEEDEDIMSGLPTPPASHGVKFKGPGRKRKRGPSDSGVKVKVKKIKLRLKAKTEPPCCLCPNDIPRLELLPTDHGLKAHRICALYLPETYIDTVDGNETIFNVSAIHKDRLELKCLFCRSKRGACFQCSQKKCARAYHASCAAAAGVFVEEEEVPVFGEDGTEYKEQAFEFSCRFHRTKRDKKFDADALEADDRIRSAAQALKCGDICQMQYYKGDIFAGLVVENRPDEEMLLLDIIPNGDRIEVDWKWLLLPDPSDYHLPKASSKALPLPTSRKAKEQLNAKRHEDEKPRKDDVFAEGFTWAEFHTQDVSNEAQAKVDLDKPDQVWFYLGKTSTDARAQYTDDPAKPHHNPKGNFLDTIPKPPKPPKPVVTKPSHQRLPKTAPTSQPYPYMGMGTLPTSTFSTSRPEKPYIYKPKIPAQSSSAPHAATKFIPNSMSTSLMQGYNSVARPTDPGQAGMPQRFEVNAGPTQNSNLTTIQNHSQSMTNFQPWQRPATNASTPAVKQHVIQSALGASYNEKSASAQNSQQKKHTWHVYSSVYQKYPFFQVHHNRDSSKYRTPYAPWGGFTNGYQGDLRAHLSTNHNDLLRRASMTASNPGTEYVTPYAASSPYKPVQISGPGLQSSYPSAASPTPATALPGSHPRPFASGSPLPSAGNFTNHPGPVQGGNCQSSPYNPQQFVQQQQQPSSAGKPRPKPVATPKPYKVGLPAAFSLSLKSTKSTIQIPSKQSPVPLPANFLAAITSGPPTPATSKLSQQASSPDTPSAEALPSNSPPAIVPASSVPKASMISGLVSTTPVPLPRLPGMTPYQAAARFRETETERSHSVNHTGGAPLTAHTQGSQMNGASATTGSTPNRQNVGLYENQLGNAAELPAAASPNPSNSGSLLNNIDHESKESGDAAAQPVPPVGSQPQEFPDVPGCESMEFVERMMQNLKRASQRTGPA